MPFEIHRFKPDPELAAACEKFNSACHNLPDTEIKSMFKNLIELIESKEG